MMKHHTITLELPADVFELLQEQAETRGEAPDHVAIEWLGEAARCKITPDNDPLAPFFGSIESGISDLAERHDRYIGQALLRELQGNNDD